MKKTLMLIAGILGLFILSSSFNTSNTGVFPGRTVPSLSIKNGKKELSLAEMRGNYVVLNFWSVSNPAGRISTKHLQDYIENLQYEGSINQVAVNTDGSEELFNAIVSNDRLNPDLQYYVSGKQAQKIKKEFMINDGVNTLLIDPHGIVVAVNPDKAKLAEILFGDEKNANR